LREDLIWSVCHVKMWCRSYRSPFERVRAKHALREDDEDLKIERHRSSTSLTPHPFKYHPDASPPLSSCLGTGTFGRVKLCTWKATGHVFAIKILKKAEVKNTLCNPPYDL